jgi:hypothetical protein
LAGATQCVLSDLLADRLVERAIFEIETKAVGALLERS